MIVSGQIQKMRTWVDDAHLAQYELPIGEHAVLVNDLIGQQLHVSFDNTITCIHCSRPTAKSFNQGYCYPCLQSLAQCDTCIVKPELCHYSKGTCREPQWGDAHCFNDHIVYLSNTGTVKVGITRQLQKGVSSRWLDQGATQAIPLFKVSNRLMSGLVETACKQYVGDKTNWRTMLKNDYDALNLQSAADDLKAQVAPDIARIHEQYGLLAVQTVQAPAVDIHYPVEQYPTKVLSINLDKEGEFSGRLVGIKGQYWLFDGDRVINIRKYGGYHWTITVQ
jgi:hypothetical protein